MSTFVDVEEGVKNEDKQEEQLRHLTKKEEEKDEKCEVVVVDEWPHTSETSSRPSSLRIEDYKPITTTTSSSSSSSSRPSSLRLEDVRRLNSPPKARWDWAKSGAHDVLEVAFKLWPLALFTIVGMSNLIGLGMLVYGTFGSNGGEEIDDGGGSTSAARERSTGEHSSNTVLIGGGSGIMNSQCYKMWGIAMYMTSVVSCFIWLQKYIQRRQFARAHREASGAVGA